MCRTKIVIRTCAAIATGCLAACICVLSTSFHVRARLPVKEDRRQSKVASVDRESIPMEFDLGSGTGRLSRKCSLERDRPGTVVSIMRSCGCTDIGVEKGQVLDRGGAFVAAVDVSSKPAGPGKQSAVIELDDGTRYEVTFRYNHKKPAFCDLPP